MDVVAISIAVFFFFFGRNTDMYTLQSECMRPNLLRWVANEEFPSKIRTENKSFK